MFHATFGIETAPPALLITRAAQPGMAEAIALAGFGLRDTVAPDQAARAMRDRARIDLAFLDLDSADDAEAETMIAAATARQREDGMAIAIRFAPERIDTVFAALGDGQATLLCDPGTAELAGALALLAHGQSGGARVRETDDEAERLRRLNEEVARIAETLARLVGGEPRPQASEQSVADRRPGYAPPAAEAPNVSAAKVRAAIRARRLRDQFFDAALFADPAWDMLLDLFAAELERARVSVSSLCIAASVPPTTALRWITTLIAHGLLEREPDALDRRRAHVKLTAGAGIAMRNFFAALDRAGLGAP